MLNMLVPFRPFFFASCGSWCVPRAQMQRFGAAMAVYTLRTSRRLRVSIHDFIGVPSLLGASKNRQQPLKWMSKGGDAAPTA